MFLRIFLSVILSITSGVGEVATICTTNRKINHAATIFTTNRKINHFIAGI